MQYTRFLHKIISLPSTVQDFYFSIFEKLAKTSLSEMDQRQQIFF